MSTRGVSKVLLGALVAGVVLVGGATAASAHRPNVKASILRLDGKPNGFIEMAPQHGGRISLNLPSPPAGGKLAFDYRMNAGVETTVTYPITGARMVKPFGFSTRDQDKLELTNLRVLDANDNVVGVMGSTASPSTAQFVFAVPLVWVVDTPSDVGFTRGGDTYLKWNGFWTVGFDALRSRATNAHLNNTGNYAEIEASINDGPMTVYSVTFDVQSGKSKPNGRPSRTIPFREGDKIQVKRVDVFDKFGNKFATMGIRMGAQGHYLEQVPPLAPMSAGGIRRF